MAYPLDVQVQPIITPAPDPTNVITWMEYDPGDLDAVETDSYLSGGLVQKLAFPGPEGDDGTAYAQYSWPDMSSYFWFSPLGTVIHPDDIEIYIPPPPTEEPPPPLARHVLPELSLRGSRDYGFFESMVIRGPVEVGGQLDGSYESLFGQTYNLVLEKDTRMLRLFRHVEGTNWVEVTDNLPPVFASSLHDDARRVTVAFDQAGRVALAYELDGRIYMTRWDPGENAYKQNVDFDGVDPVLFMDATVADPEGFPEDFYEFYKDGVPISFLWIPDGQWRTTAIPDSDVVLFYLTPDRTGVRARLQRELYATVNVLHDYGFQVVLDEITTLPGRFQLKISNAQGDALAEGLISDPYYEDLLPNIQVQDTLAAGVTPEAIQVQADTYPYEEEDELQASVEPENIQVVGDTYPYEPDAEELSASVEPENIEVVSDVYPHEPDPDELTAEVAPEDITVETTIIPYEPDEDELTASVTPEAIRVQTVA